MSSEERPEERIGTLENALALDSRLQAIEATVRDRSPNAKPWWRDARTVTILGALIAAILPAATWINNVYASSREARRLLIQQQEDIRQKYLDRVLRPGVTPVEQEQVFGLLSRLSTDPELQKWAQDELKRANETLRLQQQLQESKSRFQEAQTRLTLVSKTNNADKKALSDAQMQVEAALKEISGLRQQITRQTGLTLESTAEDPKKELTQTDRKIDMPEALTNRLASVSKEVPQLILAPPDMKERSHNGCRVELRSEPHGAIVDLSAFSDSSAKLGDLIVPHATPVSVVLPAGTYRANFKYRQWSLEKEFTVNQVTKDCKYQVMEDFRVAPGFPK
jgi:hypothetical protein